MADSGEPGRRASLSAPLELDSTPAGKAGANGTSSSRGTDRDCTDESPPVQQHPPSRGPLQRVRGAAVACTAQLNAPTLASLLGLVVGCTPLRGVISADGAPLKWVLDGMNLIGSGAVPLVIFTLGATLSDGPAGAGGLMPRRTIIAVLVAKLLVVPICALGTLLVCLRLGLLPTGDGLLPLAMLIIGASPTAMNISTIATLQGTGAREVASIMFYEYILAILTVSLVSSVGLVLFA